MTKLTEYEEALAKFNPGDAVHLKVGGPTMSVWRVVMPAATMYTGWTSGVYCKWIDKQGRPQSDVYSPEQLEAAEVVTVTWMP